MKSIILMTFVASISMTILSMPVYAQETNHIKWSQLTKKLEDQGFKIREIDQKYDGFSAEVRDENNRRYELRLDSQGNITRKKHDD